jgi:hypothetical protein
MKAQSESYAARSVNIHLLCRRRLEWLRPSDFGFPSDFGLRTSDFLSSVATFLALVAFAPWVCAQPLAPRIGYAYPAGGRQGNTVQLAVGGQYLNNAGNAYVSGAGVEATVLD